MLARFRILVLSVALASGLSAVAGGAQSEPSTLLVIPARYRIVQLAFDLVSIRPISLVSYQTAPDSDKAVLHTWAPVAGAWNSTDLAQLASGEVLVGRPARAILIGEAPAQVASAFAWCDQVQPISTLDMKEVVNDLNETLDFSPREWRWLAARHGLVLKDLNAERRRYGRYGPPGSKQERPAAESDAGEPMASPVVLEPEVPMDAAPVEPTVEHPVKPPIVAVPEKGVPEKGAAAVPLVETAPEDK